MRLLICGSDLVLRENVSAFLEKKGVSLFFLDPIGIKASFKKGNLQRENVEGFDGIIFLPKIDLVNHKKLFFEVEDLWILAHILVHLYKPPKVFITTSSTFIYGDSGKDSLSEASKVGDDLLSSALLDMERVNLVLVNRGVRVVTLREGLLLSNQKPFSRALLPLRLKLNCQLKRGGGTI